MNVYDFDKTIYYGDCTIDFWKHCVKKYPKVILAFPSAIVFGILFYLKLCKKEQFKQKFYAFLKYVPNVQYEVEIFWDSNIKKIKMFYKKQKCANDVIISASPDFLIAEVSKRLEVQYIASKVNSITGILESPNCYGNEKVKRFKEQYPYGNIERFYSDSISDIFMAKEAKQTYIVKENTIKEWRV